MSACINTAPVVVCFTAGDGTKQSLIEHIIYNADGISIGQAFTTASDTETIIDVSGGTVTAGACPVPSPDVEWSTKCDDVNSDGTDLVPFACQVVTSFGADCLPIVPSVVATYELDKITPYTVVGDVLEECPCALVSSLGTITDWADLG